MWAAKCVFSAYVRGDWPGVRGEPSERGQEPRGPGIAGLLATLSQSPARFERLRGLVRS